MLVDADPLGGVEPGRQRRELFDGALAKGLRETPVGRRTWLPVEEQLIPDVALLCVQLRHVRSVRRGVTFTRTVREAALAPGGRAGPAAAWSAAADVQPRTR